MQCPYCGSDSSVTETRVTADGLRRRRVCGTCKRRFTTYERASAPSLKVEKRDGTVEPFDGDKLMKSLRRIARYRPNLREDDIRRVARDIEASLIDQGHRTVAWSAIVAAALERLEPIDRLAAQRLRANYVDETGAVRLTPETESTERPQLGLPGVDED